MVTKALGTANLGMSNLDRTLRLMHQIQASEIARGLTPTPINLAPTPRPAKPRNTYKGKGRKQSISEKYL